MSWLVLYLIGIIALSLLISGSPSPMIQKIITSLLWPITMPIILGIAIAIALREERTSK